MSDIRVAIKPKYATRRATDKVLLKDEEFVTIVPMESKRQILSQFATAHVAFYQDDKFYPVEIENYEEQFDLVDAGEAPTVEADEKFGILKLEQFIEASKAEICAKVQEDIVIKNAIATGTLVKVVDYKKIGDEKIDANGFWFIFGFDADGAAAAGYSDIKLISGEEVAADNYIFMGKEPEDVAAKLIALTATLTIEDESAEVTCPVEFKFKTRVDFASDDVAAIEVDGREYPTLVAAFAALPNGGKVTVNKSIEEPTAVDLNKEVDLELELKNNATITLVKRINLSAGSLVISGEGTIKEKKVSTSPLSIENTNKDKHVYITINKGITMQGLYGTFFNKASYNLHGVLHGNFMGQNNGTDNGGAFYVNGNVKSGDCFFDGTTEGSLGIAMYIAGNANVTLANTTVTGTDTGVEIRAGSLKIYNARIECSNEAEPALDPNGNGSTSVSCGIAVAQHTTKLPIHVEVDGATVIAKASIAEGNPHNNPTATEDTDIHINSGTFVGKVFTRNPETDCTKFLYGGVYSEEPDAMYIADGYEAVARSSGKTYEIKKAEPKPETEEEPKEEENTDQETVIVGSGEPMTEGEDN